MVVGCTTVNMEEVILFTLPGPGVRFRGTRFVLEEGLLVWAEIYSKRGKALNIEGTHKDMHCVQPLLQDWSPKWIDD